MRRILLIVCMTMSSSLFASGPKWLRHTAISPSGNKIAFTYKGDIYVTNVDGGKAKAITTTSWYETNPIWSNNGKMLAFASDQLGNFDVYISKLDGSTPKRLTTNSASETPRAFSKDGENIYFTAYWQKPVESVQFPTPWKTELYSVSINGGRATQKVAIPIMNLSFLDENGSFLYENRTGSENSYRKHHTSSVARDIWEYNAVSKSYVKLTSNKGEDRNPIILSNDKIAFLSERNGGSFNVYIADKDAMNKAKAVTTFKDYPVRNLSASNNNLLCFSYGGEIYTQKIGESPKKVVVDIVRADDKDDIEKSVFRSAHDYAITPDGKQLVLICRGEVFATNDEYSTTKQITNTPNAESDCAISPDGKIIVYASERDGKWDIFKATMGREDDIDFSHALVINEQPLFKDHDKSSRLERTFPQFSPDGKELAYIEDRKLLKVVNLKTMKVRQITDGTMTYTNSKDGFNYQWSPNGKWFALEVIANRRDPYCDIAITSADKMDTVYNITESAYFDASPRWVLGGNAIAFESNRLGMRSQSSWGSQEDAFIAFLNQKTFDEFRLSKEDLYLKEANDKLIQKKKDENTKKDVKDKKDKKKDKKKSEKKKEDENKIDIQFDRIQDYILRLTPMSSNLGSFMLSKDGKDLFFTAAFEGNFDLWKVDLKSHSSRIIDKGVGAGYMQLSKDGKSLFVLGGHPQKVNIATGKGKPYSFMAEMQLNHTKERAYMFNHVFNQEKKKFLMKDYHGVDLDNLKKKYEKFLPSINNNYDFSMLLSEVLGELNVSHTGSGFRGDMGESSYATAKLGLLYDLNYKEAGLKIAEVVENGPFDKSSIDVEAGDVIEKINGKLIIAGKDFFPLLKDLAGKRTLVAVYSTKKDKHFDVVVKPTSASGMNDLMYKRWVKHNAATVKKLSNGRLGYVHIKSMGDASYRDIYSDILGRYNLCDGIVIDTRNNGGGRLHEDIEVLFTGKKYLEQVIRGRVTCEMPSRRWNKPSIMLVCEANYSNAHGTPWVYQHMKIGKIVGMPVPGTMSSVNWETLQDPSIYFGTPVLGYRTQEGNLLENTQLEPDFKVENTAESVTTGEDEQLEKAVNELLKQIDANSQTW